MKRVWIVLLSIAAAWGVDKKGFASEPAASYPSHRTQDKVTVAAKAYDTDALALTVFGKVKPHQRGILPVLVVIQNDTGKALRLDLKAEFVFPDGQHVDSMPGEDVVKFQGIQQRPGTRAPSPLPIPRGAKKGPLNTPEIESREFRAKMLAPGESAHGFFYFQANGVAGAQLYLTGIKDAASGQAYFYFELPLDAK